MQFWKTGWLVVCVLAGSLGVAAAQSTTGTIRGQVTDADGLAVQGVAVIATSPSLQGAQRTTTSANGDYVLTMLPPGRYHVTFERQGFALVERDVALAVADARPLDVTFQVGQVREKLEVVGTAPNVLSHASAVATSFPQALIQSLPTNRDINASMLMASAVHPTGPNGAYTIAGAVSFENLFMVDGVSVVENLRGQPYDLYVEDAIQDTTVATSGISAEHGRFTGGVVNLVTKTGGNRFSGSFRDTLQNDRWRGLSPFEVRVISTDPAHRDTRVDKTVPIYEYTFGGPAVSDRVWFFTAGRNQRQEAGRTLVGTAVPYAFREDARRFEIKGTYSATPNHRLQGVLTTNTAAQTNGSQNPATSMDLNSLYDGRRELNLFTLSYNGVIRPWLFVETRTSVRNETLRDIGARSTDRILGTLLIDRAGRRYWSATFCGVCDPEERDGQDVFVKASYFLSTNRFGSHEIAAGYDGYNDRRFANNHQSGSDYRISGTNSIIRGTGLTATVFPQFLPDGHTVITWQPILVGSSGTNFRTHSFFYNDRWRMSPRVTASLGLRYDRNHGANSAERIVTRQGALSPRVGVTFDPAGDRRWTLSGSVGRYVAAIANTIADTSSPGGNFDSYSFVYGGAAINGDPAGALLSTADALKQVFDWFDAQGGVLLPLAGPAIVRGLTPQTSSRLRSPDALEYAGGVAREIGTRGTFRTDFVHRSYGNFYVQQTDLTIGRAVDNRSLPIPPTVRGRAYDLTLVGNTAGLSRRYTGLTVQTTYRVGADVRAGGAYTLARLWGNYDGESLAIGPTPAEVLQYPEYKQAAWNNPSGALSADQRHRARAWVTYQPSFAPAVMFSALQILESGVPYGAVGTVNSAAYVANPGYVTPPTAANIAYYYTARDAFRTEGQLRTDLGINIRRRLDWLEFFGQVQVLNVFNQAQLCACGASTVFQNGGSVVPTRIDQAVRTAATNPARYAAFNPFTTAPVEGQHWDKGPSFGTAINRQGFTTPRTLRITFGVRF
jgi:hypothetical protein